MIKVGFCVSYDWYLLKNSLPRVYKEADLICLAVDRDRHSWSCKPYNFDEEGFNELVRSIDLDQKVIVYEDDFSISSQSARENCNMHRNMLADKMGNGGWHIQVDCDEYFLNFASFVSELRSIDPIPSGNGKGINVCVNLIPVFKKLETGYLLVSFGDQIPEYAPFATNIPDYQYARRNGYFNRLTKEYAIHETWSRSEEELSYKLSNWGHSSEELSTQQAQNKYLELWRNVDAMNYQDFKNIHPVEPGNWPQLEYVEANDINELIERIGTGPKFPLSDARLRWRNNRNVARIKHWIGG